MKLEKGQLLENYVNWNRNMILPMPNFLNILLISKLIEPMVKDGQAKVKQADKMLMLPALFDGEIPEKVKTHYERFNQYIKFQTKESNIKDPTKEAINYLNIPLIRKL